MLYQIASSSLHKLAREGDVDGIKVFLDYLDDYHDDDEDDDDDFDDDDDDDYDDDYDDDDDDDDHSQDDGKFPDFPPYLCP